MINKVLFDNPLAIIKTKNLLRDIDNKSIAVSSSLTSERLKLRSVLQSTSWIPAPHYQDRYSEHYSWTAPAFGWYN